MMMQTSGLLMKSIIAGVFTAIVVVVMGIRERRQ